MFDMIVASDMHWGIGKNNKLLTQIPEDMRFFKKITLFQPVVMGRKTKDSLPKGYLDERSNIVLSRDLITNIRYRPIIHANTDITEYNSFNSFFNDFNANYNNIPFRGKRPIIIGGAQIYKEFLDKELISRIYFTQINNIYDADVFIPNLYDYGFKYDPTHPLNVITGYEDERLSENGKDKFSIKTLIKR